MVAPMHQWEIYYFPHPKKEDSHPCVILSPEAILQNKRAKAVNVLACQTLYSGDKPEPTDVLLNEDDGLEHATVVKCQFVLFFRQSDAGQLIGKVTQARRRAIRQNVLAVLGLLKET
jgi:mRNA-degrading endonuclease toxin of MazEF toxin-antitoxin module